MSDPIRPTAVALVSKLAPLIASSAATAVHWPFAPEDRVMPYVLLDCLDAPDLDGTFGGRTWTRQVWAVRVVAKEDADEASNIAGEIDDLLEEAELSIAGFRNLVCTRERVIVPRPVLGDDGVTRIHAGGEYTIGVGESS